MNPSIKTKQKNEKLAFDIIALKTVFRGREIPPATQEKITVGELLLPKLKKRRTQFNTLSCGEKATIFFLKNPTLIPIMLAEADKRHQQVQSGEDMTSVLLNDSRLYDFCRDQSNAIYTQDDSDCRNYNYSSKYRQIQSNFAWTMEQAALAAQMALTTLKVYLAAQKTRSANIPGEPFPLTESERHEMGLYDWRDKTLTPEKYDRVLEDDQQDREECPEVYPALNTPKIYTQGYLPGFEQVAPTSTPKVRKIMHQGIQNRISKRIRQYGS